MSPRRIFDMPGLLAPCYTGRDTEFKSLEEILDTSSLANIGKHDGGTFKRVAIFGMPGAGKTQLALKYASTHRGLYSAVFFVSAASGPALDEGCESIVNLLGLPERSATESGIKIRAARAWLEDSRSDDGRPWLLIIDNIHPDIDNGNGIEPETEPGANNAVLGRLIRDFLPREGSQPQGSLILTTRKPEAAKLAVGRNQNLCIELKEMNEIDAVALLCCVSGRVDDEDGALSVVKELGCLPLAVNQAAAFISAREIDFQLFLEYFREEKDKVLGGDPDDPQQDASTVHIYRMAFNGLVKKSPVSADIFHIFSFLDPGEIPLDILIEGSQGLAGHTRLSKVIKSPVEYLTAVAAMRSGSLAQYQEKGRNKTLWIHDLVQYLGRQWLNSGEQREWMERTIDVVNCAYPDALDTYDSWKKAKKYRKHVMSCARHAEDLNIQNLHLGELVMRMSWYLRQIGELAVAKQLAIQAVKCAKVLCEGQQQHMNAISNLGLMHYSLASFRDAQKYFEMALEMAKNLRGPGYVDTGIGNNLALIYYQQGRFKEAEKHHLQIYLRRREVLGDYHPETLGAMGSLANSYHFQGRLEEALELKKRILDGRKKRLGDTHPETWGAMGSLATTFSDMGFWSEAEMLQAEVLKGREDQWGTSNPESLAAKGALSYTFYLQGRFDEAAVLQEQVLKERNTLWTDNHVETLGAMKHLGNTYRCQGRLQKAAALQEHAVFGMDSLLGKENPEYLEALGDLATTYREQQLVVGAENYERQVKNERERIWGPNYTEILRSMEALSRKHQGFAH